MRFLNFAVFVAFAPHTSCSGLAFFSVESCCLNRLFGRSLSQDVGREVDIRNRRASEDCLKDKTALDNDRLYTCRMDANEAC